jgi:hypothetical protein
MLTPQNLTTIHLRRDVRVVEGARLELHNVSIRNQTQKGSPNFLGFFARTSLDITGHHTSDLSRVLLKSYCEKRKALNRSHSFQPSDSNPDLKGRNENGKSDQLTHSVGIIHWSVWRPGGRHDRSAPGSCQSVSFR